jgi:protocatechuate 3,4-dioxygenase beta subunit
MADLTPDTVTDAVLAQMADTPDERLREIMAAAVKHLHAFAREVKLTPQEWLMGIAFLTEVGQTCTAIRQETILLSDTLGLSALVNLMHDRTHAHDATDSSLLGPFYRDNSPKLALGDCISAEPDTDLIVFTGQVRDQDGNGIAHAGVEVWQTDAHGSYDLQIHGETKMDHRARFECDAAGRFHFRTVRPLAYYIPMDGPVGRMVKAQNRHGCRPAHIHFLITAPGHRELVTALYLGDDNYIDSDVVFGVSEALVITPQPDSDTPFPELAAIRYDFTLAKDAGEASSRVGADPSKLMHAAH